MAFFRLPWGLYATSLPLIIFLLPVAVVVAREQTLETCSEAGSIECSEGLCCNAGGPCCASHCCMGGALCYNNSTCCDSGWTPCSTGCCKTGYCCGGQCCTIGVCCGDSCCFSGVCLPGNICIEGSAGADFPSPTPSPLLAPAPAMSPGDYLSPGPSPLSPEPSPVPAAPPAIPGDTTAAAANGNDPKTGAGTTQASGSPRSATAPPVLLLGFPLAVSTLACMSLAIFS
eukprot:TRINITY_DN4490_c0_g1_i1.p1 TRINITY_DN4490_c0_g1~~TRINITY_DN4490_c0_g1_i1.p1  ORF type:complete len:229 (+),score=13.18 TRINITY_DN4490_c0_g1_i1:132-818(+)